MVYGLCHVLLRDPVDAEDATQQTFLLALRALLEGKEPREERAWLATIARNECLGRMRTAATRPLFVAEDADLPSARDTAAVAEGNDARTTVLEAVRELPSHQRDAFVLRELFGLSYDEIATALGVTRSSVESLLFRARQRLQADLQPVRSALGALTLPVGLQQTAFGAAAAAGSAGTGALAVPTVAKIAAAAIAVGGAGTAAGVEVAHHHHRPAHRPAVAEPVHHPPAVRVAGVHATPPAHGAEKDSLTRRGRAGPRARTEVPPHASAAARGKSDIRAGGTRRGPKGDRGKAKRRGHHRHEADPQTPD
jgi:RNA polymerase sigma-70 factor (ECF subfamily)